MSPDLPHDDHEWRARLTPQQYRVLRRGGTERPFTGAYHDCHEDGIYRCAGCGAVLFTADDKYDSGTGWPSFVAAAGPVQERKEGLILRRTEVRCGTCDSHLGHVFGDGPRERGGQRYCINSAALELDTSAEGSPPDR